MPPPGNAAAPGSDGSLTEEQRQELAKRFRDRGGFGPMVARMVLRQQEQGKPLATPTTARSQSDLFARARRVRDRNTPGQATTPPAPTSGAY
jgi:hypothetical protein